MGPIVAKHHRNQTERVALIFADICSADAAILHPNQDFIVLDSGNGKFLNLDFLRAGQYRATLW